MSRRRIFPLSKPLLILVACYDYLKQWVQYIVSIRNAALGEVHQQGVQEFVDEDLVTWQVERLDAKGVVGEVRLDVGPEKSTFAYYLSAHRRELEDAPQLKLSVWKDVNGDWRVYVILEHLGGECEQSIVPLKIRSRDVAPPTDGGSTASLAHQAKIDCIRWAEKVERRLWCGDAGEDKGES